MKKKLLALSILSTILLTGCGHEHTFSEANCTEPKTCTECGETEGEALGHTWIDADCESPKTCSVCGATEGEPLNHKWLDATYDAPKTCELCGLTEGEPLEESEEGEYRGDDAPQSSSWEDNLAWLKEMYDAGEVSEKDYRELTEAIQERINGGGGSLIPNPPSTPSTPHVDVPGTTPYDPSQDGQYELGQGGEVPDYLKGDVVN